MANRFSTGRLIGKSNRTSNGGNRVVKFTSSGLYTVPKSVNTIDMLVVGGGGGGGDTSSGGGGGGGAGGFRNFKDLPVSYLQGQNVKVTIGAGGGVQDNDRGLVGETSTFHHPAGNIEAMAGGYGGTTDAKGGNGGSGGGSGYDGPTGDQGDGNTPAVTPGQYETQTTQGHNGGIYNSGNGGTGGGGAGAAGGQNPGVTVGGAGGIGAQSSVTGYPEYYAGGGGGSSNTTGGNGGLGGGGRAGNSTADGNGIAGIANTGGGGGGDYSGGTSAAGGSGVVIVNERNKASGIWDMRAQHSARVKEQWPEGSEYEITNSICFNDNDSAELNNESGTKFGTGYRQNQSNESERIKTFACWFKLSTFDTQSVLCSTAVSGNIESRLEIGTSNEIKFADRNASDGTSDILLISDLKIRDPAAWYHIVLSIDTTQDVAANRVRIYLNGEQIKGFSTETYPSQNYDTMFMRTSGVNYLGTNNSADGFFDGYLTEVSYHDGYAFNAGDFGTYDDDCPSIWKPRKFTGNYGRNGWLLQFKQNSSTGEGSTTGVGADTSGNLNHWTTSGVLVTDQSIDSPTNNFCTFNPLANGAPEDSHTTTLSEGNTLSTQAGAASARTFSTQSMQDGKWYWEVKMNSLAEQGRATIGVGETEFMEHDGDGQSDQNFMYSTGALNRLWDYGTEYDDAFTALEADDTMCFALDVTATTVRLWIRNDGGAWFRGGDPADNTSTPTADHNNAGVGNSYMIFSGSASGSASTSCSQSFNWGNPHHAISSGNSDANGHGSFEFAVPSGYYALCSRNQAQYG